MNAPSQEDEIRKLASKLKEIEVKLKEVLDETGHDRPVDEKARVLAEDEVKRQAEELRSEAKTLNSAANYTLVVIGCLFLVGGFLFHKAIKLGMEPSKQPEKQSTADSQGTNRTTIGNPIRVP